MLESLFWFLSDFLLFTPDNYLSLLRSYNLAIWPFSLLAFLLGAANLVLLKWRCAHSGRLISLSLAAGWLWAGLVFHGHYFTGINWAAPAFALLFILQATLLVVVGVIGNNIHYPTPATPAGYTGLVIYLFALLLYPALTAYLHQGWEQAGYYGTSADATCLATLGLLLISNCRGYCLLLPLLWCIVAAAMAWVMEFATAGLLCVIALSVLTAKITVKRPG